MKKIDFLCRFENTVLTQSQTIILSTRGNRNSFKYLDDKRLSLYKVQFQGNFHCMRSRFSKRFAQLNRRLIQFECNGLESSECQLFSFASQVRPRIYEGAIASKPWYYHDD